jgi:hypothetical protein
MATYRADAAPPVVTTTGSPLSYAANAGAVPVDPGVTVADPDSAFLSGATVSITGGFVVGQDVLAFTNQNGITGPYNGATGVQGGDLPEQKGWFMAESFNS